MSSSERNSFVAALVKEFGLASDEIVAKTFDQLLANTPDSDSDFLEEMLLERDVINQQQKDRLSQIVAALDSIPNPGDSASTIRNELTVESPQSSKNNGNGHQPANKSDVLPTDLAVTLHSESKNGNGTAHSNSSKKSISQNRFQKLRPYAQGGLGSISVAHDTEISRIVALKEIQQKFSDSRESRERFLFEGQVTGQLEHPGIVPVYSLGTGADGRPFYTMRLVHGTSMGDEIKDFYEFEFEDRKSNLLPWLRKMTGRLNDVCMAIEFAHSRDVLHRDIKPSNIMLGEFGETLVVDWGLAKSVKESSPQSASRSSIESPDTNGSMPQFTQDGAVIGTIGYMSPEQAAGSQDEVNKLSDVFCLGSTLYALLTGHGPYSKSAQLEDVKQGVFVRPRKINRMVPRSLEAICLKAMETDPKERYPSARALAEDLENWNTDQLVNAWREPWLDRVGRFLRRYRTAASACFIGLLALTAGLFAYNSAITDKNTVIKESNFKLNASLALAREASMKLLDESELKLEMASEERVGILENIHRMYTKIHQAIPENDQVDREYARVLKVSANALRFQSDRETPPLRYQKAVDLLEKLTAGKSVSDAFGDFLALSMTKVEWAAHMNKFMQFESAEKLLLNASQSIDELAELNPDDSGVSRMQAIASTELMIVYSKQLEWEKHLESSKRAKEAFEKLVDGPNTISTDPIFYIRSMYGAGQSASRLGRKDQALQLFAQAEKYGESVLKKKPERNVRFAMTTMYRRYCEAILEGDSDSDTLDNAERIAQRWRFIAAQNSTRYPGSPVYQFMRVDTLRFEGKVLAARNDLEKAREAFNNAKRQLDPLVKLNIFSSISESAAKCRRDLALLEDTNEDERIQLLEEAVEIVEQMIAKSDQNRLATELKGELEKMLKETTSNR